MLKGTVAAAQFMLPSFRDLIMLLHVDLNVLVVVSIEHFQPVVHKYAICYLQ